MMVKAWLYWQLSTESYFYKLYELGKVGGPDGIEYHGEYIVDLGEEGKVVKNMYDMPMIEYKGELCDLRTQDGPEPIPYIYSCHDGHIKKIKFSVEAVTQ
jgi:hypothetical protein